MAGSKIENTVWHSLEKRGSNLNFYLSQKKKKKKKLVKAMLRFQNCHRGSRSQKLAKQVTISHCCFAENGY